MKSLVSVLGLLLGISGVASAPLSAVQQGGNQGKVSLRTSVGVFAPILPVVSIANGWMRYLPSAAHYHEPDAAFHYEILNATLAPEADQALVSAGLGLRSELA